MIDPSESAEQRASTYSNAHNRQLEHLLGAGKDGSVFSTTMGTAVKVFHQRSTFQREWNCYRRLQEMNVFSIAGHHVPQLVAADEQLWVVEMTIVQPPFLLDFASAFLDVPPDFSDDAVEQWQHAKREEFESNWSSVLVILHILENQFGIYLLDVHPGNITFGESVR